DGIVWPSVAGKLAATTQPADQARRRRIPSPTGKTLDGPTGFGKHPGLIALVRTATAPGRTLRPLFPQQHRVDYRIGKAPQASQNIERSGLSLRHSAGFVLIAPSYRRTRVWSSPVSLPEERRGATRARAAAAFRISCAWTKCCRGRATNLPQRHQMFESFGR